MEEQKQPIFGIFDKISKQTIFDLLGTNYKYNCRPFSQQDLKVDVVIRMRVPTKRLIPKEQEIVFDKLFTNLPTGYQQVYDQMLEFVHYLTMKDSQNSQNKDKLNKIATRCMTTLHPLEYIQPKNISFIDWMLDQRELIIDCENEYLPNLDSFIVYYNMIMMVLQRFCGFQVRSLLQNNTQDEGKGQEKVIYILISQKEQKMMRIADRISLKKEVNITDKDYQLNDPMDQAQRPIKYHTYFREHPSYMDFVSNQKNRLRILGIKEIKLNKQIFDEAQLQQKSAERYISYYKEMYQNLINSYNQPEQGVSNWEKAFLFKINRQKINKGCLKIYRQKKVRRNFYEKLKAIDRKYGYQDYQYGQSYFDFRLPEKTRPFFEKLEFILNYKSYVVNKSGQISLFTKLQRIKLCYLTIERFLKLQNFPKYGLDIYAIHDNYERYGHPTHQDSSQLESVFQDFKPQNNKIVYLQQSWHAFLPFKSSIKKIRDYMGQNIGLQVMVQVYLSAFFLMISPLSFGSQYLLINYFYQRKYIFSFIQITIMVISLNLLIVLWQNSQRTYFDNFNQTYHNRSFRDGYKGEYIRDIVTDQLNTYSKQLTLFQIFIRVICYVLIGIILMIEGVFFWGMRISIVKVFQYGGLIYSEYLSFPHFIFYGIYFFSNEIIYQLGFLRLIDKMAYWVNLANHAQHQQQMRMFMISLSFGIQLMGPFFFYIIQPLQGVSCYSQSCTSEFSKFIYARYALLFIHIFIKFGKFIWILLMGCFNKLIEVQCIPNNLLFEERVNYLMNYVKKQYKKKQLKSNLREKSLCLYHYALFKINFPICTIFTYCLIQLDYIFERMAAFKESRRQIPNPDKLFKFSTTLKTILHMCIIVNVIAITFNYSFIEYQFKDLLQKFVNFITDDNVMSLKIFVSFAIIICLQTLSSISRNFYESITYDPLQKRKHTIFNRQFYKSYQFYKSHKDSSNKMNVIIEPIKTIFRTFTFEGMMENKKEKYKLYDRINPQITQKKRQRTNSIIQSNNKISLCYIDEQPNSNQQMIS